MPSEPVKSTAAVARRILPAGYAAAVWRGFRGRCPACGEGCLFRAFLKVNDACPRCGEEIHHHRADNFPAYLVLAIVGHILVPIVLSVETHIAPPVGVSIVLWPSLALVRALSLLQPETVPWRRCNGLAACTASMQLRSNGHWPPPPV